jgi:hypothetical protein
MPSVIHDAPGAQLPPALLAEARAFLSSAGHPGGGGLHRCARVLVARQRPGGPIVAVVAGQQLQAMDGQRRVSCIIVQQLCLAPGWARHGALVRTMAGALLRAGWGALILWSAPTASEHAAAASALPSLLPRFGERLPGASAAIRDRVMSRTDPHGWDPLRGGVTVRGSQGGALTRHVCLLRTRLPAVAGLLRHAARAWWARSAPAALPTPAA